MRASLCVCGVFALGLGFLWAGGQGGSAAKGDESAIRGAVSAYAAALKTGAPLKTKRKRMPMINRPHCAWYYCISQHHWCGSLRQPPTKENPTVRVSSPPGKARGLYHNTIA